jgi:peptide/nickel transport system substrate-binding protein
VFIANFKNVEAVGASTIVFHFLRPWAPFLINIAGLVPILPKHIWNTVSDPTKFTGSLSVMGSGPYRLHSFDIATGSADFVANDDYFLGKPYVRRIEFVPAPDQLLALRRGDIDAANADNEDQVPAAALAGLSSSRFGTVKGPSDWTRALQFNLAKGYPYNDVRFRKAVAYAIDRPDLITRVLFGHGVPGSYGLLAPADPYFEPGLPTYPYNPSMANSLLDQVGLTTRPGSPVRDLPSGDAFTVTLQTSSQFSGETATIVSEDLRKVGIAVTIDTLDPTTADSNADNGAYDMALVGYGGVNGDPDALLRIGLSSKTIPVPWKAQGYDNPTVEALGQQQLFTQDDPTRTAAVQQIQRIVAGDVPIISLYLPTPEEIFNRGVFSGWFFTPGGFAPTATGVLNKVAFISGKTTAP